MPSTRAMYYAGTNKIWGTDMLVFLYKDYKYNPDNPEKGLF